MDMVHRSVGLILIAEGQDMPLILVFIGICQLRTGAQTARSECFESHPEFAPFERLRAHRIPRFLVAFGALKSAQFTPPTITRRAGLDQIKEGGARGDRAWSRACAARCRSSAACQAENGIKVSITSGMLGEATSGRSVQKGQL